jgi:hypothetical protein
MPIVRISAPIQLLEFAVHFLSSQWNCCRQKHNPLARCAAEREQYLFIRTLPVFQCSAALNHMGEGRPKGFAGNSSEVLRIMPYYLAR